jgi:glycosyltransferase involved in cell wall biosynthesis
VRVIVFRTDDTGVAWNRIRIPVGEIARQGAAEIVTTPTMMPIQLFARSPSEADQASAAAARALYEGISQGADILHTQRVVQYEPFGVFNAIRFSKGIPWVIDVDDNVLDLDPANPAFDTYRVREEHECYESRELLNPSQCGSDEIPMRREDGTVLAVKQTKVDIRSMTIEQLMSADAIFTSTTDLACLYGNLARKSGHNPLIYVLPNSLDLPLWDSVAKPADHHGEIWVGWAGSASHAADVEILAPVMDEVLASNKNVRFFWTKLESPRLLALHKKYGRRAVMYDGWVRAEEWANYYTAMNFDISLGPLNDTPFNRGKSNLKWLESAVLGQSFVCSDVGPYTCIKHGRDGFRCTRPKQWIRAINDLATSETLRRDVGGRARERVRAEFDIKNNCHLWVAAYEDILKRRGDACKQRSKELILSNK